VAKRDSPLTAAALTARSLPGFASFPEGSFIYAPAMTLSDFDLWCRSFLQIDELRTIDDSLKACGVGDRKNRLTKASLRGWTRWHPLQAAEPGREAFFSSTRNVGDRPAGSRPPLVEHRFPARPLNLALRCHLPGYCIKSRKHAQLANCCAED